MCQRPQCRVEIQWCADPPSERDGFLGENAGAPQIMVGENVFLFLDRAAIGSGLTVVGFSQGKFSVVDDVEVGKAVARNLSGITLRSPAGARRGNATRVPLNEFRNEIRRYLAGR